MNDSIEITLPVSGKKVVIRNYTTVKDDNIAEAILKSGVASDTNAKGETSVKIPLINISNSTRSYVDLLTQSIDGNGDDIKTQVDNLRSLDFKKLESTVDKIIEENSPKVVAAKTALKSNTNQN